MCSWEKWSLMAKEGKTSKDSKIKDDGKCDMLTTNKRRLTIGVDFGTTYSGVAYSNPKDESKEPLIITDWGAGLEAEKVPTVIRYNVADCLAGVVGFKWGYQVKSHERRQEWFKLSLDPMTYMSSQCVDMSQTYQSLLAEPPDYCRDTLTLVTDYLTALRKQVIKQLERKFTAAALKTYHLEWVITTPAIWSAWAKEDTLRCAEKAGMGSGLDISLVSEPEAAAAYALSAMEPLALGQKDNIVVCDAGGGTVDLITYRINSLSPLEVEESAISNGGKCGGVFINRIFEKMINDRLGKDSGLTEIGRHQLLNHFETYIKRDWADDDPCEEYFVPAPGARNNVKASIAGGSMIIRASDLKTIFEPVVKEVLQLVRTQIDSVRKNGEKVSAVLLVGGFGQSRYLRKRLEEDIHPVSLICPPNGWSAIARGAVIQGIASRSKAQDWRVFSRKATEHYGMQLQVEWNESFHDPKYKEWDDLEGKWMCGQVMEWVIHRGDDLSDSNPRIKPVYRNIRVKNSSFKWTHKCYTSFDDYKFGPYYRTHKSVQEHADFEVDLTSVPLEKFNVKRGANGEDYYKVSYDVVSRCTSAFIEYSVEIEGKTYGKIKTHYCR